MILVCFNNINVCLCFIFQIGCGYCEESIILTVLMKIRYGKNLFIQALEIDKIVQELATRLVESLNLSSNINVANEDIFTVSALQNAKVSYYYC